MAAEKKAEVKPVEQVKADEVKAVEAEKAVEMKNVIFHRPIRLGKVSYPKAKRSVPVPAEHLQSAWVKGMCAEGGMTIVEQAAKPADGEPKGKAPVKP